MIVSIYSALNVSVDYGLLWQPHFGILLSVTEARNPIICYIVSPLHSEHCFGKNISWQWGGGGGGGGGGCRLIACFLAVYLAKFSVRLPFCMIIILKIFQRVGYHIFFNFYYVPKLCYNLNKLEVVLLSTVLFFHFLTKNLNEMVIKFEQTRVK